ncbi:MAG: HAD-IIB family hydrolase [Faecalibacillus sp.]
MKTVVTDLDGTILNNGKLSYKTIEVLKDFQQDNRLILATGRNLKSVEKIFREINMNQYQTGALILVNGLETYDFYDQEHLSFNHFQHKDIKKIIRIAYLLLFRITIVGENERVQYHCLYDRLYYLLRYIIKHKPMIPFEKKHLPENIQKIELGRTVCFSLFYKLLRFFLHNYEVVKVNQYWVEILPKGTNKNHLLTHYIKKYKIEEKDLYIFGDGENDVDMLKNHIHTYAPENAMEEAKKAAHFQCGSCQDDGVASIIEKIKE